MQSDLPSPNQSRFNLLPLLTVIFLGAFAYLMLAPQLGFVSDDYVAVYGGELMPYRPIGESIRQNNPHGSVSPMRLFNAAVNGYLPYYFGGAAAHTVQAISHLLCATSIYWLLRRLKWDQLSAAMAFGFFACVPWVFQSVSWWSAGGSNIATLMFILTLHVYLSYSRTRNIALAAAAVLMILLGLSTYELWFPGFVSIFALEMYERRKEVTGSIAKRFWITFKRCWFFMLPFMVWGIWAAATYINPDRRPALSPIRIPIIFASIHARFLQFIAQTPWSSTIRDGMKLVMTPAGAIIMLAAVVTAYLALKKDRTAAQENNNSSKDLLANLLLAWGLFLGGRLIFILQNGIALISRHNYGGAVGVAIAIAAIIGWLAGTDHASRRRVVYSIALILLAVISLATAGLNYHYRESAIAEKRTVQTLMPYVGSVPQEQVYIVIGKPTNTKGELGYFYEFSGAWLEELLRRNNPEVWAYVVDHADFNDGDVTITVIDHTNWSAPYNEVKKRTHLPTGSRSTVVEKDLIKLTFNKAQVNIFEWIDGDLKQRS